MCPMTRLFLAFFVPIALVCGSVVGVPSSQGPLPDSGALGVVLAREVGKGEEFERLVGDVDPAEVSLGGGKHQDRSAGFLARVTAHYPHLSGPDVSGHVSWDLVNGSFRKLPISAKLESRSFFMWWDRSGTETRNSYPGTGRGKGSVARFRCRNSNRTHWRTAATLYAPGSTKSIGRHFSKQHTLNCGI